MYSLDNFDDVSLKCTYYANKNTDELNLLKVNQTIFCALECISEELVQDNAEKIKKMDDEIILATNKVFIFLLIIISYLKKRLK